MKCHAVFWNHPNKYIPCKTASCLYILIIVNCFKIPMNYFCLAYDIIDDHMKCTVCTAPSALVAPICRSGQPPVRAVPNFPPPALSEHTALSANITVTIERCRGRHPELLRGNTGQFGLEHVDPHPNAGRSFEIIGIAGSCELHRVRGSVQLPCVCVKMLSIVCL